MKAQPEPEIPTLYDETSTAGHVFEHPALTSIGEPYLAIGARIEFHEHNHGSFSIGIGPGEGVFVSESLLKHIPAEHRPSIDTTHAGQTILTPFGDINCTSLGGTLIPVLLEDPDTGKRIRIILWSLVVKHVDSENQMYIASSSNFWKSKAWKELGPAYGFGDFMTVINEQSR